jgi:hypothetical protein
MKKLLIFFIMLLFNIKVYAINYNEDSDFSAWQEEKVDSNELISVEQEQRYRWYKEDRVDGSYYIEGSNDLEYPLIDYNDYKLNTSDWLENNPDNVLNRSIEERLIYKYKEIKPIRYINLFDMAGSTWNLKIPELNVYVDDIKIDYKINCGRCSNNYESYINDNNIYQDNVYIYNWYEMYIDLNGYYDPARVRIELYLYDQIQGYKFFSMAANNVGTRNDLTSQYYYQEVKYEFFCNNINEVKKYTFILDKNNSLNPEWSDYKYSLEYQQPSQNKQVEIVKQYRYTDHLYKYYKINKQYYDEHYYKESPDTSYLKDLNNSKIYYRYKTKPISNEIPESNGKEKQVIIPLDNQLSDAINTPILNEDIILNSSTIKSVINTGNKISNGIDNKKNNIDSSILPIEKNTNYIRKETSNIKENSALAFNENKENISGRNKYIYILIGLIILSIIPIYHKMKK